MLDANFWQDKAKSQKIVKEKKLFEDLLNSHDSSNKQLKDLDDLYHLALDEKNIDIQKEVNQNIKELRLLVKKNEIKCFLSNEADSLDSYIEINAGAGGTESQDWANMLRRMYAKWADSKNFKFQIVSEHKGDEAGIKSATIKVEESFLYFLQSNGLTENDNIITRDYVSPFSYQDQVKYFQYGGSKDITKDINELSDFAVYWFLIDPNKFELFLSRVLDYGIKSSF